MADPNNLIWDPVGQSWAIAVPGAHMPECNSRCTADSHFLMPR